MSPLWMTVPCLFYVVVGESVYHNYTNMSQTQKPVSLIMRTRSKCQCYQIWTTTLRPYFASNVHAESVHGEWKYLKLAKLSCQNCVLGLFYYEKPGYKRVPLCSLRDVQNGPKTNSLVWYFTWGLDLDPLTMLYTILVLFILSICSGWHKCGSFDWRRVPREKRYFLEVLSILCGCF